MKRLKIRSYKLIHAREVFHVSLIVVVVTIFFVWLFGLGRHQTFFENSMLSLSILSIAFFCFVTMGLYKGYKLQHIAESKLPETNKASSALDPTDLLYPHSRFDISDSDDGCAGVIVGILLWILTAVVIALLVWFFANVMMVIVPVFMGMLYWIFFRAIRLVFKNSRQCRNNLLESIKIGLTYTVLYNFWIYGIFLLTHYFKF
jgi:hypothetical protein